MFMEIILPLLAGVGLLYVGAESLIRGSVAIAFRLGISALVIGLTVVAYGTSSPELFVSLQASIDGNSTISLGNVIGSNIANIGLILGIAAMIYPITISVEVIKREIPIMISVTIIVVLMLLDQGISRIEGMLLLGMLILYTVYNYMLARKEKTTIGEEEYQKEFKTPEKPLWINISFVVVGFVVLIIGSNLFVAGAVSLAKMFQISDLIIGLTIIAVGTSLPEFATSVLAAIKKESDIAVGNVVGSNIFNVLGILGIVAIIHPIENAEIKVIDLGIVLLFAVVMIPVMKTGMKISRLEGLILLMIYVVYVTSMIS